MKWFSLALIGAAALVVTGGAQAADIPVKAAPESQPQPVISGYLGFYVGSSSPSVKDNLLVIGGCCEPERTVFAYGALGAVNMWIAPAVSLQFSALGEATNAHKLDDTRSDSRSGGILDAHLALRDPQSHALGIFAAYTKTNNWYVTSTNEGMLVGFEAQKYIGNTTLYGQVGYGGQFKNRGDDMFDKYWFARGVIRHYFDPNLRVSVELSYASGTAQEIFSSSWPDLKILGWGANVERRFANSPFSVFAEYAGDRISGSRGDITLHTFLLGGKFNFGEPTLIANERRGTAFDSPKFFRAMPGSCWAVGC